MLVAAPVALAVFFIPYAAFAALRPLLRLGGQALIRGLCALHVYGLRPAGRAAVAAGNFLADVFGASARAIYNYVLAPIWSGLQWCGRQVAAAAEWTWENCLLPSGQAVASVAQACYQNLIAPCAHAIWSGVDALARGTYNRALVPLGHVLSSAAEFTYGWVLVPVGHAICGALKGLGYIISSAGSAIWSYVLLPFGYGTWEALKFLGGSLARGAELAYSHVVLPIAQTVSGYILQPLGQAARALARGAALAVGAVAYGVAGLGRAIFDYVLLPCFNAGYFVAENLAAGLSSMASAGYQYVVVPVASAFASAGSAIFSYVLVPCGHGAMAAGRVCVQLVVSSSQAIYVHVLCPAGHASRAAAQAVQQAFQQFGTVVRVTFQTLLRT